MKISNDEQAWVLEGLRIIKRRLQYQAEECAVVHCDAGTIRKAGDKVRQCGTLVKRFENLAFTED